MWTEWLARTLKPRPIEDAAVRHTPEPPVAPAPEETCIDEVRLSTARLSARAQDEEVDSLAADV